MTPKEKAIELVDSFRIILMNEDTDCRNKILYTLIAIKNAKVVVEECLKAVESDWIFMEKRMEYWSQVKEELNNIWNKQTTKGFL